MAHETDRRAILLAAGSVALAAATGAGASPSTEIRGTVEYEGGEAIPKGRLEVYLRDGATGNGAQEKAVQAQIQTDGGSNTISFSFSPPAVPQGSSSHQIVATLERADGWLLARGSATYDAGRTVRIILYTAMY